jgi:membrane protein required for colicin V production
MNLFDASLVLVAVVSVIVGAMRGFVREAAALAGWILAVVLVLNSSVSLGRRLPFEAGSTGVRTAIAAILIVLACILTAHLIGRMLKAAISAAQLAGPDRALGAVFGIARAGAVWLLVAAVAVHLGLSERPFWKSSRLAPVLEAALRLISPDLAPSTHRPMAAQGV